MLDVHPPHHAASTWRDFFIHIATIVIGLLIAIGLEQTVEYIHQRHERHQLEEDLLAEATRSHAVTVGDIRRFQIERPWLLALRDQAARIRDGGGKLKLPYLPRPTTDPDTHGPIPRETVPPDVVWSTARESQLVALLPRPTAELYARHYLQHTLLMSTIEAYLADNTELLAFESRFEDGNPGSTPDLSRMSPADLNEYSIQLTRNLVFRDRMVERLIFFDTQNRAILNGARTEEDLGIGNQK